MIPILILISLISFIDLSASNLNLWNNIYSYNDIRFRRYDSYSEMKNEKELFSSDGIALQNIALGVIETRIGNKNDKNKCIELIDTTAFHAAQRYAAGGVLSSALIKLTNNDIENFPIMLNGCAELLYYKIGSVITEPDSRLRTNEINDINIVKWMQSLTKLDVSVYNHFDYDIEMYFHDESSDGRLVARIKPNEGYSMGSFLGHVFQIVRAENAEINLDLDTNTIDTNTINNQETVDYFIVDSSEYIASPSNRLETCSILPSIDNTHLSSSDSPPIGYFTTNSTISCNDLEHRFHEMSHLVWHDKRLGLNYVQPKLVRGVTDVGFELKEMPKETFKWLQEWYRTTRAVNSIDESNVGPCMNQHQAMSEITHLPSVGIYSKERLGNELKPMLSDWYHGNDPLFLTSIYGVRRYTNGSILRMHVDTVGTHVVSAIINVDQNVTNDWPLIILGHNDEEYSINMKPGDILLYESAKLLHGRPEPMNGLHYDNIFVHYAPVDNWDYQWV